MRKIKKLWLKFYVWFKRLGIFKKILLVGAFLFLLGVISYSIFKPAPPPQFRTMKATIGNIEDIVEASGPIAPITTTEVGALVSGEILKIYVDYNSVVKKGDLMAIIDPTQIQANYDQAKASLGSAQEELQSSQMSYDLAETNLKRYRALYDKEYVSKVSLEEYELGYVNAKSALNSAKARVIQNQATLDKAEKDLSNTKIVSPIDGIVLSKDVSEGQSLTSGFSTPKLFVVAQDLTKMQIEAKVSEADVVKIKEGQKADFTLDGYPDEKFEGVVRQVRTNYVSSASTTTTSSTSYTVVIDVNNDDLKLMPGMTATITIKTQEKKDVLTVPNEALRFSPSFNEQRFNTTGVWVQNNPEELPRRVDVGIGIIATKRTEVVEGDLKAGDNVVVSEANARSTVSGRQFGGAPRR